LAIFLNPDEKIDKSFNKYTFTQLHLKLEFSLHRLNLIPLPKDISAIYNNFTKLFLKQSKLLYYQEALGHEIPVDDLNEGDDKLKLDILDDQELLKLSLDSKDFYDMSLVLIQKKLHSPKTSPLEDYIMLHKLYLVMQHYIDDKDLFSSLYLAIYEGRLPQNVCFEHPQGKLAFDFFNECNLENFKAAYLELRKGLANKELTLSQYNEVAIRNGKLLSARNISKSKFFKQETSFKKYFYSPQEVEKVEKILNDYFLYAYINEILLIDPRLT